MLITNASTVDGRPIREYRGIVVGQAIMGANVFRDFAASIRDVVGGRSGAYENEIRHAREIAIEEMTAEAEKLGASAIVGFDLDYESISRGEDQSSSMLMVSASGTAVVI